MQEPAEMLPERVVRDESQVQVQVQVQQVLSGSVFTVWQRNARTDHTFAIIRDKGYGYILGIFSVN